MHTSIKSKHTSFDDAKNERKNRVLSYLDGRTYRIHMLGGMSSTRVCLRCRKAGAFYNCCNRRCYTLGYRLRAPRVNAGRGKWKKFKTLLFQIPYNRMIRTENLALDIQEQM